MELFFIIAFLSFLFQTSEIWIIRKIKTVIHVSVMNFYRVDKKNSGYPDSHLFKKSFFEK